MSLVDMINIIINRQAYQRRIKMKTFGNNLASDPINPEELSNEIDVGIQFQQICLYPFGIILIAFTIVWCRRKIDDFYLKSSIIFLVCAMAMRTCMSGIFSVVLITKRDDENVEQMRLLLLKMQVFSFTIPYYLFFMVSTSLLFSAF